MKYSNGTTTHVLLSRLPMHSTYFPCSFNIHSMTRILHVFLFCVCPNNKKYLTRTDTAAYINSSCKQWTFLVMSLWQIISQTRRGVYTLVFNISWIRQQQVTSKIRLLAAAAAAAATGDDRLAQHLASPSTEWTDDDYEIKESTSMHQHIDARIQMQLNTYY